MAENIIARWTGTLKLDPVEDAWLNGMFHNVCGPVTIVIFKRGLGENAEMEGGVTFCSMVVEADGKNVVVPAFDFPFNYLEDKISVEFEPAYSDKDDRFIQDYRFDVSKLEPSASKRKKVEVTKCGVQTTLKFRMDINIFAESQDQVERLVPRSLRKLAVILLPVLVELLACLALETLMLTIVSLRYVPLSRTGIFLVGWATRKHRSIHLTELQHQHLHTW